MFRSMFFGENPLSNLSLHVLWAPTLCIMGGQLWFLGHVCSSYTCMGSALDVMDYGLAEAMRVSSELTARTLLILRINTLWSQLRRFFR